MQLLSVAILCIFYFLYFQHGSIRRLIYATNEKLGHIDGKIIPLYSEMGYDEFGS